jgi:hypothetical protein
MSREIDLSKPLSDEDRQYLLDRNRLADIRRADGEDVPPGELPDDSIQSMWPNDPRATGAVPVTDLPAAPLPGQVLSGVTGQPVAPVGSEATEPEDNYDDDDAWSYRDLQEEAKGRNLTASGSREELVQRLREDDATPEEDSSEVDPTVGVGDDGSAPTGPEARVQGNKS